MFFLISSLALGDRYGTSQMNFEFLTQIFDHLEVSLINGQKHGIPLKLMFVTEVFITLGLEKFFSN